jgi:ADP-ribose pyrophosphatase YjhB (NUDIX family)
MPSVPPARTSLKPMHPSSSFRHCPSCGIPRNASPTQPLHCPACNYTLYFNTTCATAAFLERPDGMVLFIRRAKDPAKDKLAIPGGFIDEGETAEHGLQREFTEEVGLQLEDIRFLCSHPNSYHYKGLVYPVLDFFFTARIHADAAPQSLDGVASTCWLDPASVDPSEVAFPSMVFALERFLERRRNPQ